MQWQLPSFKTRHLPLSSKNIANTISHQKIATIVRGCNGSIRYFTIASTNAKNIWKAMFELKKSKRHSILWSLVGIYKIRMFLQFEIIPIIVVGFATISWLGTLQQLWFIKLRPLWLGLLQLYPDCDNCVCFWQSCSCMRPLWSRHLSTWTVGWKICPHQLPWNYWGDFSNLLLLVIIMQCKN